MGLFDFIFGNKKKEEQQRLENEREFRLLDMMAATTTL